MAAKREEKSGKYPSTAIAQVAKKTSEGLEEGHRRQSPVAGWKMTEDFCGAE